MAYIEGGSIRTSISNPVDTKTKLDNETIAMLSSIAQALNKISDSLECIQDEIHVMNLPKVKGTRDFNTKTSVKETVKKKSVLSETLFSKKLRDVGDMLSNDPSLSNWEQTLAAAFEALNVSRSGVDKPLPF